MLVSLPQEHAFGVDDGPLISLLFPVPFPEWVTSAETYWSTLAKRPSADFTVGSATAPSGQKATGYIAVPAGVDAAANIPVIVVNGAKPGPGLALVAGSHGTEYASILALQKLAQAADPGERPGTLIIVPLSNMPSAARESA